MNIKFTRVFLALFIVMMTIGLSGCGSPTLPDLPPGEIVALSADRMRTVTGFEFSIDRSGEPAYLDPQETVSFRRAVGKFTYPDGVMATVRVIAPGLVTEVHIISIEGTQWETNLLTGEWQASDPRYSFNPAVLFDPETGIQKLLATELKVVELLGFEELAEIPGLPLLALTATMEGDQAYSMTYGMIDRETLAVKLWVEPLRYDLYRMMIVDPRDEGEEEDTTWQIDFWNFDQEFEIAAPD